jgi:hypothetical protein
MPGKSDCQVKPEYLSRFEPVNLNLTKRSGYNPGCNLKILNLEKMPVLIPTWILTGPFYRYRLIPQ